MFCSIYHLDETLPQFINTLYGLVHTCTQACLLLFLFTCIQWSLANNYANTNTNVLSNKLIFFYFFLHRRGEKLPILFVSSLIMTSLCLSRFMSCQKLPENMSWQSLAMVSVHVCECICTCVFVQESQQDAFWGFAQLSCENLKSRLFFFTLNYFFFFCLL